MTVKKLTVVGSGTAGLINALIMKRIFVNLDVEVISSDSIGIVGVGEGSTEHWSTFEKLANINRTKMVEATEATFKFGIRFRDWTNHTPDYFHSISGGQSVHSTFIGTYNAAHIDGRQLTPAFGLPSLTRNLVADKGDDILGQTNQFHFDTHKLNDFLRLECSDANVMFTEGEVIDIGVSPETGDIETLMLEDGRLIETDFVVDASGFRKAVISKLEKPNWCSYSDYLPTDSAVVFPTPEDPVDGIKPYTLAQAMSAGWMWEIPTQSRRGNGYVFSSSHISDEDALKEAEQQAGHTIGDEHRFIRFEPGYLKNSWVKNCVAIGLSSGFVEPLEATSIAASINQSMLLTSYLPVYSPRKDKLRSEYLRIIDSMMGNLLAMIAMHYVSDREDTDMWLEQKHRPRPDLLNHLMDIMSIRGLEEHDVPVAGYELFRVFHFWHVAQGQGLVAFDGCEQNIALRGTKTFLQQEIGTIVQQNKAGNFIPHKDALMKGLSGV